MTTQPSLFLATRPGVFAEAVSLAARSGHREPSTWVTKPRQRSRPYARSVVAGLSVVIAVVGATLLMAA